MNKWLSFCAVFSMALSIITAAGCGSGSSLVPTKGKLTVDGKPAEGASILFHPIAGPPAKIAAAAVSADGSFAISTDGKLGVEPGTYDLSVTWPGPAPKQNDQQKMFELAEPGPDQLKGRYVTKEKAKLQIEIKPDTKELAPIDLKAK